VAPLREALDLSETTAVRKIETRFRYAELNARMSRIEARHPNRASAIT
jgi:BMFP domain-containing protein YqiC